MDEKYLPNINKLCTEATSTTVPLSLRVKESTKALFDTNADKIHVSTNALINSLLDLYADQVIARTMTAREANKLTLRRHLEITTKKAYTLDYETLLSEVVEINLLDPHQYNIFWGARDGALKELIKECAMWAEGKGRPKQHFRDLPLDFYTRDATVRLIATPFERKASVDVREFPDGRPFFGCLIRIDYWIVLIAILTAYETKMAKLFPDWPTYLGKDTFCKIAQSANTASDRKTFAESATQTILTMFEDSWPEAIERRQQNWLASEEAKRTERMRQEWLATQEAEQTSDEPEK